jgi:hypothetical protein
MTAIFAMNALPGPSVDLQKRADGNASGTLVALVAGVLLPALFALALALLASLLPLLSLPLLGSLRRLALLLLLGTRRLGLLPLLCACGFSLLALLLLRLLLLGA